jgi:serine/threonine-protein kinase
LIAACGGDNSGDPGNGDGTPPAGDPTSQGAGTNPGTDPGVGIGMGPAGDGGTDDATTGMASDATTDATSAHDAKTDATSKDAAHDTGAHDTGTHDATGTADGGGATPDASSGACGPYGTGVFEPGTKNPWNEDISCLPASPGSSAMMGALAAKGGWGPGLTRFQIDMSLVVLHANDSTPLVPMLEASGYGTPDCDNPASVPLPVGGAIEGSSDYSCDVANNDCHLLIVQEPAHKLFELYQATMNGSQIQTSCAVVWDLTRTYPTNLRGDQCTSADAAGFPMAAMLPDADEVASGRISHAIRFALPNPSMRAKAYVHPASHAGGPSGDATLPPYGVRLRLRPDYPTTNMPPAAKVIVKALQTYGMYLSDGGNIPLMVQSDQFTQHKWADADLGLDSHSLFGIAPTDFDVVELGPIVDLTYDCVRNP